MKQWEIEQFWAEPEAKFTAKVEKTKDSAHSKNKKEMKKSGKKVVANKDDYEPFSFAIALRFLKKGVKVRKENWAKGHNLYLRHFSTATLILKEKGESIADYTVSEWVPVRSDFTNNDWILTDGIERFEEEFGKGEYEALINQSNTETSNISLDVALYHAKNGAYIRRKRWKELWQHDYELHILHMSYYDILCGYTRNIHGELTSWDWVPSTADILANDWEVVNHLG